jgi:dipeptidyl aminopeptidase/acylaminoacyl peptidase
VAQIMQEPKDWLGSPPSSLRWAENGEFLYFSWNPQGQFPSDSLYKVPRRGGDPIKVEPAERRAPHPIFSGWQHDDHVYDAEFRRKVFVSDGDLYLHDLRRDETTRLTETLERESSPRFSLDDASIYFSRERNFFRIDLETGSVAQLTDFRSGEAPREREKDDQDEFLEEQQLALFDVIRKRKEEREAREEQDERDRAADPLPPAVYSGRKNFGQIEMSPGAIYFTYTLSESGDQSKSTKSVTYVTASGYAEEETWRSKVGTESETPELHILHVERDTTYQVDLSKLPGAYDVPAYRAEQGVEVDSSETLRVFSFPRVIWSPDARYAVLDVSARDNKDRWIARLDPQSGKLSLLDRQHDDAWIGGPGIGSTSGWIPGTSLFYFQSERTGWSHLYTVDVETGEIRQLTHGPFEVYSPRLSKDGETWYFSSSEVSPFERHYYRMDVEGGERQRLTTMAGGNDIELHPDEDLMANLFSLDDQPPEIHLQRPGREAERITNTPTDEWKAYDWRVPEIIHIEASDGVPVPAQIFVPENPNGAGVIFVHGAGYLQNVHSWWSSYFREYMFNNMLTDLGYYVLNIDYRASSGYGRDWRTAIYRHMGGRDLQDHVDGSRFLQSTYGVDPDRIAIYGGSYGGFITLMALFTEPEHFGAGAALRSVTDWAHYNHGYTSNILNTPATDSLAYVRSSPIYFAEGLEDPLLMPHGMIDNNVHFQDIVRLTQRLIELGKEDWDLAVYPIERHGFTEADSWTDEYRRILKLIEENVGPR